MKLMEEERSTGGWSARQLIRQLQGSAGSRQQAAGPDSPSGGSRILVPPKAERGSRQFDPPTQEESQSRTRRMELAGYQSTDVNRQFDGPTGESNQSRTRSAGASAGQGENRQSASAKGTANGPTGQASGKKTSGKKKSGVFKGLISGTLISESLILKDIRYTALIALIAVIFIANKFNAERVERQIIVLEQEVRDMRAEALSVSAELGSVSRQSEITELVKERGLGLEELREPPFRIVVNE